MTQAINSSMCIGTYHIARVHVLQASNLDLYIKQIISYEYKRYRLPQSLRSVYLSFARASKRTSVRFFTKSFAQPQSKCLLLFMYSSKNLG
jgi:hypothetical protein